MDASSSFAVSLLVPPELCSPVLQVVLGGDGPSPTIHSTRAGAGEGGGYPWLFSASEVRMVTQFLALPTAAQGLYARLLNRKGACMHWGGGGMAVWTTWVRAGHVCECV
jgi:hypothetical protein